QTCLLFEIKGVVKPARRPSVDRRELGELGLTPRHGVTNHSTICGITVQNIVETNTQRRPRTERKSNEIQRWPPPRRTHPERQSKIKFHHGLDRHPDLFCDRVPKQIPKAVSIVDSLGERRFR